MKEQPQDRSQSEDARVARREFVKGAAAGVVGGLAVGSMTARAQDSNSSTLAVTSAAFSEAHQPKPLPFDAASLNGLSAQLIESHWSNNYSGSVRALNEIKRRLGAALGDTDLPAYVYNDL